MSATSASFSHVTCLKIGFSVRQMGCLLLVLTATLALQTSTSQAVDPPTRSVVTDEPTVEGWGLWQPANAPHLVLRPHRQPSFEAPRPHGVRGHSRDRTHGSQHRPEHVGGPRPAVPEAATIYRRKVPYSYGYFGARERRHWAVQRGHQEDRIQWVLR